MKRHFSFLLLLLFAMQAHAQPTIHYVIPGGTGNGTSWQDGGDLAQMLTQAQDNDEVWVMQGYYYLSPVEIYHSISVYGGFTGTEPDPNARSPLLMSRSVVDLSQNQGTVPSISVNFDPGPPFSFPPPIDHFVMDGFILHSANTSRNWGGALRADSVNNLFLRNLFIYDCMAIDGGGMYLNNISFGYMENVFFNNNYAYNYGGGLFLSYCTDFTMVNTAFTNNHADCIYSSAGMYCTYETFGSGGVFIESSNVVVHNMTATCNGTDTSDANAKRHAYKAGCIAGSNVAFYNSIIYPDTMNIEYNAQKTVSYDRCCLWTTQHSQLTGKMYDAFITNCVLNTTSTVIESNIFSANPLFDFGTYNPFPYLQPNSPCIDAGSYSCGTLYDLFGNFRVTGIDADLGAMEYQQ